MSLRFLRADLLGIVSQLNSLLPVYTLERTTLSVWSFDASSRHHDRYFFDDRFRRKFFNKEIKEFISDRKS